MTEVSDEKIVSLAVGRISNRLPAHINREDLHSEGFVGLLEARENFDPSRGVKFATFAVRRVEGAILDYLRGLDWVPRSARTRAKELDAAHSKVSKDNGSAPDVADVAAELGISVEECHALADDVARGNVESLDGGATDDELSHFDRAASASPTPAKEAENKQLAGFCLDALNDSERAVVIRSIIRQEKLREIGADLGFSESRACQVRDSALKKMRRIAA